MLFVVGQTITLFYLCGVLFNEIRCSDEIVKTQIPITKKRRKWSSLSRVLCSTLFQLASLLNPRGGRDFCFVWHVMENFICAETHIIITALFVLGRPPVHGVHHIPCDHAPTGATQSFRYLTNITNGKCALMIAEFIDTNIYIEI